MNRNLTLQSPSGPRTDCAPLDAFLGGGFDQVKPLLPALSLFSGAGIGDYGYRSAGFRYCVLADLEPRRLAICRANHPGSVTVAGDLRETWHQVVKAYRRTCGTASPALLTGMPPCEAMSWANSWTGADSRREFSSDPRNSLALVLTRAAQRLRPRVIVLENVIGIFTTRVRDPELEKADTIAQLVVDRLPDYECWPATIQFANYGIPQRRQRALLTFIRRSEPAARALLHDGGSPYPPETHDRLGRFGKQSWVSARKFLGPPRFAVLDSSSAVASRDPNDPLHYVPVYDAQRYELIQRIPPHSGGSAYETDTCPSCDARNQPRDEGKCWACARPLWTRPIVVGPRGGTRLIVGGKTAYRRMPSDLPVATVTTANGHIGSDSKIHPWENRLLSIRECEQAQTIPRTFRWPTPGPRGNAALLRGAIGDAIPPWFTFLHGRVIRNLLFPGKREWYRRDNT
jgi:DNA (cytosine-5)-methyltransferase 1